VSLYGLFTKYARVVVPGKPYNSERGILAPNSMAGHLGPMLNNFMGIIYECL
jgi:hypothetical protein